MTWVVLIAVAIVAADQLTKWLVVTLIHPDDSVVVIDGFFTIVNWRNTGAAWGIFQDYNTLLAVVSLLTILVLYLFRQSFQLQRKASRAALGLILGGIVGNVVDRVRVGYVVDFLDFYITKYHWPAFNVADSAICIGVALYILISWRSDRREAATVAEA